MIRAGLFLALLVSTAHALTGVDGVEIRNGQARSARYYVTRNVTCNAAAAQNSGLSAALSAAAGGTLFIPAGCVIPVGTPGAGSAVATVPANTAIVCEDSTAGFQLMTATCLNGTYPGKGCTTDSTDAKTGCPGSGTCTGTNGCCSGLSTQFAPTGGSTYTLFTGSSNSGIDVRNCLFDVKDTDGRLHCHSGTDNGKVCAVAGDCVNGDCTLNTANRPTGSGSIKLLDFSGSTYVRVTGTRMRDIIQASLLIGANHYSSIKDNDASLWTQPSVNRTEGKAVDTGILVAGYDTRVSDNMIVGVSGTGGVAVSTTDAVQRNHIRGNTIFCTADTTAYGFRVSGGQSFFTHNFIYGCYHGIDSYTECGGGNVLIAGNRFAYGCGPQIRMTSAGWKCHHNYLAWTTGCASPTARAMIGSDPAATVACGAGHAEFSQNLVFSDTASSSPLLQFTNPGKRCFTGTRVGLACSSNDTNAGTGCPGMNGGSNKVCYGGTSGGLTCTTDADCPGPDSNGCFFCGPLLSDNLTIQGNKFLGTAHTIAVDLSGLSANAGVSLSDILDNTFPRSPQPIAMPSSYASTIRVLNISGNSFGGSTATTQISAWDDRYGINFGNYPLTQADYNEFPGFFVNEGGGTITVGDAVELYNNGSDVAAGVRQCASGAVCIGIAADTTTDSGTGPLQRVVLAGETKCSVDATTALHVGDRLKPNGSGVLVKAGATDTNSFAVAMEAKASGTGLIRCAIGPSAGGTTPAASTNFIICGSCNTQQQTNSSQKNYCGVGAYGNSSNEARTQFPITKSITISKLYVKTDGNVGANATATLRKNLGQTTGTGVWCQVNSGTSTCNDQSHTLSYNAGDTMDLEMSMGSSSTVYVNWCVEIQ